MGWDIGGLLDPGGTLLREITGGKVDLTPWGEFGQSVASGGVSDAYYGLRKAQKLGGGEGITAGVDRAIDPGGNIDTWTRSYASQAVPKSVRPMAPAIGAIIGNMLYPGYGAAAGYGVGSKIAGQSYREGFRGAGISLLGAKAGQWGGQAAKEAAVLGGASSEGAVAGTASKIGANVASSIAKNAARYIASRGYSPEDTDEILKNCTPEQTEQLSRQWAGGLMTDTPSPFAAGSGNSPDYPVAVTKTPEVKLTQESLQLTPEELKKLFEKLSDPYKTYGVAYDLPQSTYSAQNLKEFADAIA